MSMVELVILIVSVSCGVVSLAAAVLASRYHGARGRKREMEQMTERRSSAAGQLQRWRNEGMLLIEDEALEAAIYWEQADPDSLERLVHTIQTFIEEKDIEPDNPLVLAMARQDAKGSEAEKSQARRQRLELIAGFG